MDTLLVLVIVGVITAVCESRDITVSSSQCGGTYSLDSGSITLEYNGDPTYRECQFTISTSDDSKEICSSPYEFIKSDCDVELEYHNGYYSPYPAESFTCGENQSERHCTSQSTLVVVFKNDGGSSSDQIELIIYEQSDISIYDVVDAFETAIHVTVGIIVGIIVLVIIVTVVVAVICCRRRQGRPGQVYRGPQAGVVTTTTYPMQGQPGYQPVQAGYQPPPQPGYQPPPQPGYQPQPAAYPPAPQQGYAGYQTGPDANAPEKASAPPMGMQPPPYPGN